MTGHPIAAILVVDSRGSRTVEARLPRVLAALGRFAGRAHGFEATRRADRGDFHDLAAYDVALLHEADVQKDDQVFFERCWKGRLPCVVFSGGIDRGREDSGRLLFLRDLDVLAHAEDGLAFLERTGRLALSAWTRGERAARQAEVLALCNRLRRPLLAARPVAAAAPDWAALVGQLGDWSEERRYRARVEELERLSAEDADRILALLDELPRHV
jgi:hypothetical protein